MISQVLQPYIIHTHIYIYIYIHTHVYTHTNTKSTYLCVCFKELHDDKVLLGVHGLTHVQTTHEERTRLIAQREKSTQKRSDKGHTETHGEKERAHKQTTSTHIEST
jgi:hypothetical protein